MFPIRTNFYSALISLPLKFEFTEPYKHRLNSVPLLVTQRHQRIDFRRAARRDIARQQRDAGQQERNGDEGQWISRFHAEEHAREHPRERKRRGQAGSETKKNQSHALPQHKSQNVPRLGSQGNAQPNLLSALSDRIVQYAEDANR